VVQANVHKARTQTEHQQTHQSPPSYLRRPHAIAEGKFALSSSDIDDTPPEGVFRPVARTQRQRMDGCPCLTSASVASAPLNLVPSIYFTGSSFRVRLVFLQRIPSQPA
jgi:hypothetical protein